MNNEVRRDAIRQAFIDPIQNVLILDDQFPTYEHLANYWLAGGDVKGVPNDTPRALQLWKEFRNKKIACDIASNPAQVDAEYLKCRDLLVLDYELTPGDDGNQSRRILAGLLGSTRQNLVIVYTNSPDLKEVKRAIAVSLAGLPTAQELDEEQMEAYAEWRVQAENKEPAEAIVDAYIGRDPEWHKGILNGNRPFVERMILNQYSNYRLDTEVVDDRRLQISTRSDAHRWVRCGSVFVVVLKKNAEHAASDLLGVLLDALEKWDPSYMRIMLAFARNGIVEQGLWGDDRVLRDAETEAAWIFYSNQSVDPGERRERIGVLYSRIVEDLLDGTLARLVEFSMDHGFESLPVNDVNALRNAMVRVGLRREDSSGDKQSENSAVEQTEKRKKSATKNPEPDEFQIIHKLNYYLAFERALPRSIRAGTIFAVGSGDSAEFGVVTTPDCDLVPARASSHEDAKSLSSFFRVMYRPAFRCEPQPQEGSNASRYNEQMNVWRKPYRDAEQFGHMYLHLPGDSEHHYLVLKLVLSEGQIPPARLLYIGDEGKIGANGAVHAVRVVFDPKTSNLSVAAPLPCKIIGQLRDRYALRLLHEAGHYLSRMGVDFVRWPPR